MTYRVESGCEVKIKDRLGVGALQTVIMNFQSDFIEDYDELATTLDRCEYRAKLKKLDLDMKNWDIPLVMQSLEEAPNLELKSLSSHLRYTFSGKDETLLCIIATDLNGPQVKCYVLILMTFKQVIWWTSADIIGIPPSISFHKTQLMSGDKPSIEQLRRLNQLMQKVVKKEITKWLNARSSTLLQALVGHALFNVCQTRVVLVWAHIKETTLFQCDRLPYGEIAWITKS